jgi:hypothetical protein
MLGGILLVLRLWAASRLDTERQAIYSLVEVFGSIPFTPLHNVNTDKVLQLQCFVGVLLFTV